MFDICTFVWPTYLQYWKPEECIRSSGTGVGYISCHGYWELTQPQSFGRAASVELLFVCVLCVALYRCPSRIQGIRSPGAGVNYRWLWVIDMDARNWNGPLQSSAFLTIESPLQPLERFFRTGSPHVCSIAGLELSLWTRRLISCLLRAGIMGKSHNAQ